MPDREKLIETFGEVAQALGCSTSYAQKLWGRHGFKLKNRFRPGGRIRMTIDELERFKNRVWNGKGKAVTA